MAGRGRPKKCVLCGLPIKNNEEAVPYKNRYAHESCFRATVKVVHKNKTEELNKQAEKKKRGRIVKPKAELKDGLSNEEYVQKQLYYDYLKKNIQNNLPAKIYVVTEKYINDYSFSYQGMYQTLVYIKDILGKEFGDNIVGLIPFYYTEADNYYKTIKAIGERNKNIDVDKMYHHKTIYIDTKKKEVKQLDITTIGGDEECMTT